MRDTLKKKRNETKGEEGERERETGGRKEGGGIYGFDYRVRRVSRKKKKKVHVRVACTYESRFHRFYTYTLLLRGPRNRINRFHTFVREIDVSLYISVWRKCEGNVRFAREGDSTRRRVLVQ